MAWDAHVGIRQKAPPPPTRHGQERPALRQVKGALHTRSPAHPPSTPHPPVGWQVRVGDHERLQMEAPIRHKHKRVMLPLDLGCSAAQHLAWGQRAGLRGGQRRHGAAGCGGARVGAERGRATARRIRAAARSSCPAAALPPSPQLRRQLAAWQPKPGCQQRGAASPTHLRHSQVGVVWKQRLPRGLQARGKLDRARQHQAAAGREVVPARAGRGGAGRGGAGGSREAASMEATATVCTRCRL